MPANEPTVAISRRLWAFAIAEINEIHRLMDVSEIPRKLDGLELSVAQRVRMYATMTEAVRATINKAAGNAAH